MLSQQRIRLLKIKKSVKTNLCTQFIDATSSVMANVYKSLSLPGNRVASLNLNNSWPNSVCSDRAANSCPERTNMPLAW